VLTILVVTIQILIDMKHFGNKSFKDFNLEFLGFSFQNYFTKYQYSKLFPNDKKMINLENWNEFEIKYPSTFLGMYQFYVRKINME